MITYDITFNFSPLAVQMYLEYRYIQPNGTPSAWQTNTNVGDIFGGFTPSGPPFTFTINDVIGVVPDWQYNTTYQFRLRQICNNDTVLYSPTEGDYYVPYCAAYTTSIGDFRIATASYPIYMTIPSTVGQSVTNYIFYIYDAANPNVPLTSQIVPSSVVNASLPYQWVWDDNNVPGGIQMGTSYLVRLEYTITTSNSSEVIDCEFQEVIAPECSTYYIEAGDSWALEWTDCSGIPHICYSNAPYNGPPGWNACRSNFLLCSLTFPIGYRCLNGVLVPGFVLRNNINCPDGKQVGDGAQVKIEGPGCTGNDFQEEITWSPDYGSVVVQCQQCI